MPVRKFIWNLGNIHLKDNNLMPKKSEKNFDKLYKGRPLLDHLSEMFLKVFKPGQKQAIDESIIKFKGRSSLKQYMPKKPIKRGYKVWMRCDSSGFACEFQIYTGKTKVERNLGERVIRNLSKKLLGKNHVLFFDNYFTSYDLLKHLETQDITACGTVNMSRKNLPKNLLEDKKNETRRL
ncbi:piggyBac transposable element-derived protein 4 [Trichonephila inaurata madagascariensis]|uniref:PiggyBac transposable element-derived protein 4 n=1 Tax=Trichonephila inaurata madagascariensis TaxID=2747483 RepID=A0A8X7C3L9_9ARAC|nr:piggyBac transposable element-derived protein 4 [Trichonephila inaurata madagascariensis]